MRVSKTVLLAVTLLVMVPSVATAAEPTHERFVGRVKDDKKAEVVAEVWRNQPADPLLGYSDMLQFTFFNVPMRTVLHNDDCRGRRTDRLRYYETDGSVFDTHPIDIPITLREDGTFEVFQEARREGVNGTIIEDWILSGASTWQTVRKNGKKTRFEVFRGTFRFRTSERDVDWGCETKLRHFSAKVLR